MEQRFHHFTSTTIMLPLRVLVPNLDRLEIDISTKLYMKFIRGAFRSTFYHLYEKFNVTEKAMNVTAIDLGHSDGREIIPELERGVADTSSYSPMPSLLPSNVTAAGMVVNYLQCKLITFPKLHRQDEDSTAWDFLSLSFTGVQSVIFLSFVFLINTMWYWKEDKCYYRIFWEVLKVGYRQIFSRPKTFPIRLAIISLSLGCTIYQAIVMTFMNTDKISLVHFAKVKTLKDIHDQSLLLMMEPVSGCSQLINAQPNYLQSYLNRNEFLRDKKSVTSSDEILLTCLSTGNYLDKIAALRASISWRNFLYKACSIQPWTIIKSPPYLPRGSIDTRLYPLIMSKDFSLRGQNLLKKYSATLREQGLQYKKGIFASTLASVADPICMHSKPIAEHKRYSSVGFIFIQPLLIILMMVSALATIVFLSENIVISYAKSNPRGSFDSNFSRLGISSRFH